MHIFQLCSGVNEVCLWIYTDFVLVCGPLAPAALTPAMLHVCRLPVERHVQPGEAAILRGAGPAQQAAPGALPRLQVQAPTQKDLHRGGPQAEGGRVQGHDEEPPAGAESDLHTQVLPSTLLHSLRHFHTHSQSLKELMRDHKVRFSPCGLS